VFSPQTLKDSAVMLVLHVPDVDSLFAEATKAGAKPDRLPAGNPEGGLRTAKLIDPFGHRWMLVTEYK
jgi:PhnB protein